MKIFLKWDKLPLVLAIILYFLIFLFRYQQTVSDGISRQSRWDIKLDLLVQIRGSLDQRIGQLLPSPQAELLSGILLGQNKNLPGHLKLALRDTATLHIVVASGQNLSLLAGFFLCLAGLIKRRQAILLSLLAVSFYTLLTGMQVPILRAAVMFSLSSLAEVFGRQRSGVWVLGLTAGAMLIINPLWISDLSFQLSFLATFGVIAVAPVLLKFLNKVPLLGQDLAVTTGAQLMIMPVIIQNFHQLSIVGIFVNLLVGWTVLFIMIFGFLSIIFGPVFSLITNALLTYFIYVVNFFAGLPFAWEYIGEQIWIIWVGYYLVVTGILLGINNLKVKN